MTVKDLIKLLESYPKGMKIEISYPKDIDFNFETRELQLQDLVDRNYDWKKTLLISPVNLYPYQ